AAGLSLFRGVPAPRHRLDAGGGGQALRARAGDVHARHQDAGATHRLAGGSRGARGVSRPGDEEKVTGRHTCLVIPTKAVQRPRAGPSRGGRDREVRAKRASKDGRPPQGNAVVMGPRFRGDDWFGKLLCPGRDAGKISSGFPLPLAEIILAGARARALGRRIRIEARGRDDGDTAVLAHLEQLDPAVGAGEHPVLALELRGDALDRALGAERLAAPRAAERLLLLEQARRRARSAEIELRLERDHLLGTRRLAQPALHAGILGESESRTLRIVHQRAGRTSGYAGKTERAA